MAKVALKTWRFAAVTLCLIGFSKEFRPTTPYLTPYLISKNFTDETLYSSVYPFWTYSYLIMLIPVFVLTDFVRYKVKFKITLVLIKIQHLAKNRVRDMCTSCRLGTNHLGKYCAFASINAGIE
jgi:hypothetical protein